MITTAGATASFFVFVGTLFSAYLVPHKRFFDLPSEGWKEYRNWLWEASVGPICTVVACCILLVVIAGPILIFEWVH